MADTIQSATEAEPHYRRLRGLRWGAGRSAIRASHDHLLVCDYRTGFVERYKRFYFRDIEAIIVRRTINWILLAFFWFFFALFFLIIALSTRWNVFLIIMEVFCGLMILQELVRGPSCRTHVQTAVQTDVLPMFKRVRKTERGLQFIFPLIEEVQGRIVPERPGVPDASVTANTIATAGSSALAVDEPPVIQPHKVSWLHAWTFAIVLITGMIAILEVNYPSTASFTILIGLFGLVTICLIISLVRQTKHRVHGAAAAMIWMLAISYLAGAVYLNFGFSMINTIQSGHSAPYRQLTPYEMRPMPGFNYVLWGFAIWSILIALFGLIFVFVRPPARDLPPPMPSAKSV